MMIRQAICTSKAPACIGPYSQAISVNNLLFLSGQLGLVPDTMELAGDVEAQTHQALRNMREVLQAAKLSMHDVVKTTILLSDITDFYKVNAVYEKYFIEPYPARVAYQVAALPKNAKVEIEAIAAIQPNVSE